jgi:hypothetical protein
MALPKMKPLLDPAELPLQRLDEHPRYKAAAAELAKLKGRYEQAEQRQRVAQARARGQKPTGNVTDRAAALVAGGRVNAAPPDAEFSAATEEKQILLTAIFAQREAMEVIAGELSAEVCRRMRPLSDDAHRAALAAVEDLFAALEVARIARGRLIGAGYSLNTSAMPYHTFATAAALGDPTRSETPAGLFRQWLSAVGIGL